MDINELLEINNINRIRIPSIDRLLNSPKVLIPKKDNGTDMPTQIFDLLMDSSIRRGNGSIFSKIQEEYKEKISRFVNKAEPIHFVFQGLPFKCHNPVETLRRTPDLGELATLQRLADINETVKQIYSEGIKFTILTEGNNYIDLFGATKNEADVYQKRCIAFSKLIGADKFIQFIDFMDLVGNKDEFFDLSHKAESTVLESEIGQFTPVMMRSMPIIEKVAFEDLLEVFGYGDPLNNLTDFELSFMEYVKEGARDLAIRYLGIQKVKKQFNIINKYFSDCLYISTTSKNDKYSFHPIHKKTRLYAHHGVPVLGTDKVDIVYQAEIIMNPEIYTAVYLDGDIEDAPFYYLKGKQHIRKLV